MPDEPPPSPAAALADAEGLLAAGRPFAAHEVLEAAWKAAPPPERDLWRGLAQIAVGLTHLQRGNTTGAVALLRRGAERVAEEQRTAPHGIDVPGVARYARDLADTIATSETPVTPGPLHLRTSAPP
jgi:uncharacterized membrane-anchored protein